MLETVRVYVDEAGDFGWHDPGPSFHVAVALPDVDDNRSAVERAMQEWERSLPATAKENGEVKGKLLSDDQMLAFLQSVIGERRAGVTISGADTRVVDRDLAVKFGAKQAKGMIPEMLRAERAGDKRRRQNHIEGGGWLGKRSAQQWLSMMSLMNVIARALQHAVIDYHDGPHSDFASLDFVIDRSFISNPRHTFFWSGVLNSKLCGRSITHPLLIPTTWEGTDHPFVAAYDRPEGLDLRDLWYEKCSFASSRALPGLRVADIMASIVYRSHRGAIGEDVPRLFRRLIRRNHRVAAFGDIVFIELGLEKRRPRKT